MMFLIILTILFCILMILGIIENTIHLSYLKAIPIRIHVNGTRGKSSVTRLIASSLRSNGLKVLTKTTGTLPRIILPNGKEISINRRTRPSIIEQRKIVELAYRYKVDALVIECMALQPFLQWISESKLIKATHTLITNIRPDHLEIMGPTVHDVAECLAGSTPINAVCILGDASYKSIYENSCLDRHSKLILVDSNDHNQAEIISQKKMKYIEHSENIAITWRLLKELNLNNESSIQGIIATEPDPGAMKFIEFNYFGKCIYFSNGFATNDPFSTKIIYDLSRKMAPNAEKVILLVNLREDRADRTIQLATCIEDWVGIDSLFLLGAGSNLFLKETSINVKEKYEITVFEDPNLTELIETILSEIKNNCLVIGIGNIAGIGLEIVEFFENRQKGDVKLL